MATTTSISKLSWVKTQPESIHFSTTTNDHSTSNPDPRTWLIRHQTPVEYFCGNQSPDLVTSIQLQISPSPSSRYHSQLNFDTLRAAVRQLRFDHPAIALQQAWSALPPSSDTALLVYQVPRSEYDIGKWLATVLVDHSNSMDDKSMDIDQKIESVTYELGKLTTNVSLPSLFRVHYIPASSCPKSDGRHGLVFVLDHTLFDAIGCFQIMDLAVARIADALADTVSGRESSRSLPWGEEITRLPHALSQSAQVPSSTKKTVEDEEMLEIARCSARSVETTYTLPIPHPNSLPSSTGIFLRKFPPSLLSSLHSAARTNGCTIFNVLLSATVLSFIRIRPPPDDTTKKQKNLTLPFLYSAVNIRSLACDDPYNRLEWTVRLSVGINTYIATDLGRFASARAASEKEEGDELRRRIVTEDLWLLAKEFRDQSEKQKKYMERLPVFAEELFTIAGEGHQKLGEKIKDTSGWYPVLSSIGVIDKYLSPHLASILLYTRRSCRGIV